MKDKIIDSIGKIDNDMIESVDALRQVQKKRSKTAWTKWAAIAACLCVVVGSIFVIQNIRQSQKQEIGVPIGQGFLNAEVVEIDDKMILAECTDSLISDIPVGKKVQISLETLSTEPVPDMKVGYNIRVLYIGKITGNDVLEIESTVSIFLLDQNGEPITE